MKRTTIGIVAGALTAVAVAGGFGYWWYSHRRKVAHK